MTLRLNDTVRVKKLKTLPKLAGQYIGQVGTIVRISSNHGVMQYRVHFQGGEAIYLETELEKAEPRNEEK